MKDLLEHPITWICGILLCIALLSLAGILGQHVTIDVMAPIPPVTSPSFSVTIGLNNGNDKPIYFDGNILIYGPGYRGHNSVVFSPDTENYWEECNTERSQQGCRLWWCGTIPPDGRVTFEIPVTGLLSSNLDVEASFQTDQGPLIGNTTIYVQ